MPRISVVIPAYNEEMNIGHCLSSLCAQNTTDEFEVIVVDNNSTDNTVQIAESFCDRLQIRIISEKKQGRGAARKCGWDAATGDIVFSTDADATVPANWISSFVSMLDTYPECIGVYGSVCINDCGPIRNTVFNVFHPLFLRSYRMLFRNHLLCGFSFALKKHAYEKAGGFDPENNGQEDVDLSKRLKNVGAVCYDKNTPVTFSGRRFQNGLLKGAWEYASIFFHVSIRGNNDVALSDHR